MLFRSLVPALAVGLNWPRATGRAAVVSIAAGLVLTLGGESLSYFNVYRLPAGVPWSGVALVASLLAFISASCVSRPASRPPRSVDSIPRP